MVGLAQRRDTGRPSIAYGRRCRQVDIEHELRVTDFALRFPACLMDRGVKVGKTEPDGVMEIGGRRCFVEVDNSAKMARAQMQQKWKRYGKVDGYILVIARSEGRMLRLIEWSEAIKNVALFTTFTRLEKGLPWRDWKGATVKI